jgi:sugar lactone lactonase YvrE
LLGKFPVPEGLAVDGSGNTLVAENWYSGNPYSGGQLVFGEVTRNAEPIGGSWIDPNSVAVDGAGNIYVNDLVEGLWKMTLQADGSYEQDPIDIETHTLAVDGGGNLFTLSLSTGNTYSLYKQVLKSDGTYLQTLITGGFVSPSGVAVDGSGNVFVTDQGIRLANGSIKGAGVFEESRVQGKYVQTAIGSGWKAPSAVSVDGIGNVYVNDSGNVYKLATQTGGSFVQSTVLLKAARAGGLAVDEAGNVYVSEVSGKGEYGLPTYSVYRMDLSQPPVMRFGPSTLGATSPDSPQTVTVSNLGNEPLTVSSVQYPGNFPESSLGASDCTASSSIAASESCTITIDFAPTTLKAGSASTTLSETVQLTTNTLNGSAEQGLKVGGTVVSNGPAAMPTFSLQPGAYAGTQVLVLTHPIPGAAIYYTTQGATPTASSTRYVGPIMVSKSETVKAVAQASGYVLSPVASSSFIIQ